MESILTSIKKLLGIAEEYTHFDSDLVMHINSVFMILTQMGVGPAEGFSICDDLTVWEDFTQGATNIEAVKSYMHHKVKLLFDPPTNSAVLTSTEKIITELEWRLNVMVETGVIGRTSGITLRDRTTGSDYELYVDNSRLTIAEEGE